MPDFYDDLRKLDKPTLAASIASLVREVLCPDGVWTLAKGRDCIDVLLIAARLAFPTSADLESLGSDNTIADVAIKLADDIDVMKEEAKNVPKV